MPNSSNKATKIKIHSVSEVLLDFNNKNLYFSSKLKEDEKLAYFEGLTQALFYSNEIYLGKFLNEHHCLTAEAQKVSNSAEILAYSEFKRYYIRGICLQSIEENRLLRVCRLKKSKVPSKDADQFIGKVISPEKMLAVARVNPNLPKPANNDDSMPENRILRPNSSLCVEIFDTKNPDTKNDKGENYEQ